MAPHTDDENVIRDCFKKVKAITDHYFNIWFCEKLFDVIDGNEQ